MVEQHILLIDDSEAFLEHARSALEPVGFKVTATPEAIGAARHLRDGTLVLIDFHMPGVNGAFVASSLRSAAAMADFHECRFYLYTSDVKIAKDYREHGFDGAILQKGDLQRLVAQVSAVFRSMALSRISTKVTS